MSIYWNSDDSGSLNPRLIAAGSSHSCGNTLIGGSVECWGRNVYGQTVPQVEVLRKWLWELLIVVE